jgi:hypothetical protein
MKLLPNLDLPNLKKWVERISKEVNIPNVKCHICGREMKGRPEYMNKLGD